jgi:hypothetical protein
VREPRLGNAYQTLGGFCKAAENQEQRIAIGWATRRGRADARGMRDEYEKAIRP